MRDYELSPEAKEDLFRIYEYGYINFGEKKADEYYNNLFDDFERIADNPYHFPSAEYIRKDYRKCVSGEETIYYKIEELNVIIMAIVRSQDIGKAL